ncbi:MAG: hypothetical protein ACSHWY_11035 [Octadecabacter sp.]
MKLLMVMLAMLMPLGVWADGVMRGPPYISVGFYATAPGDLISVLMTNRADFEDYNDVILVVERLDADGVTELTAVDIALADYLAVEDYAISLTAGDQLLPSDCDGYGYASIGVTSSTYSHDYVLRRKCFDAEFQKVQMELVARMMETGHFQ